MTRWMLPIGLLLSALPAQDNLHYDFETVTALTDLPALQANRGNTLSLVSPGHGDSKQALLVESPAPSKYAQVAFKQPLTLVRNLVLSFDVRAESPDATNYVGILFSDQNNKTYFASVPFEPGWRHHELVVSAFHPVDGGRFALGMEFKQFTIYGRAKADSGARMKVWLDNVTVAPHVTEGKMADLRVSTANPPLFNWPAQQGAVTVAWSQDPAFAAAATTTAEVRDNWYTPPQPPAPGRWYWRYSRNDEFRDGWSDTMPVEITPEAHRFSPGAISLDELSRRPHPRLLNAAAERASLNAEQRAALCREAERVFQENIADDCPIWVEGDPRWPTWIDWYGKAHGGITSRAGTRLQRLATILMRTGDPQVREWTRALALKASKWDPEGGSNPGRGDIGAHHFERGLNWCYDALAEDPTTPELPAIRAALEVRAGQFWKRLNPFRGNEFNNHSWLNAFGLAESGLVLAGESPEAGAWARFVLELFVGRFLCALGYQGDNNEGISYWAYGLSFVVDYAAMMKRVVGVDLYRHPWLAQTARFPLYTTPPNAYAVSFADTGQPNHGTKGPAATREVLGLARETGDPYALWYAGAREPVAGVAPKPPVDIPQSIWYRFIGWAIHNTSLLDGRDGVTVAMRSGPFYAGHQHEDLNGFVIHAYGEKLAIDGGHYDWYGSAQFKNWSTLTRAHNSILVNGRDQGSREKGADGQITAWFDSPEYGYSVGRVADPDVYAGQVERWDRALLFLKPGLLIVRDTLAATAGPARWDWLLQSVGEIRTDPAQQTFTLTSGEAALSGQFVAPSDLDLAVTSGFPDNAQPVDRYSTRPSPPERTPLEYHLTVTPRAPRQNEEFLAVMAIDRAAEA
ncbi:MAG: DUF4962 domain-containing protein, partial [Armatimonadetes bacterium]|nr:DUF4962 domain-containing protein [Armatimonadota bacterium]